MITVEVYENTQMEVGSPVATLSFSGRGKKVAISTKAAKVKETLMGFLDDVLSLPHHSQASPDDRKAWMEALPKAHSSIPYWFRIADPTSEITEEVDDDNEEVDEDASEEESPDEGEAGGDDSGDTDDGGDGESS